MGGLDAPDQARHFATIDRFNKDGSLMSHGLAAACKVAFSGFDSHQRFNTIN